MLRQWLVVICALAFMSGAAEAACRVEPLADLPATMRGRAPIVSAQINGRPVNLMADSGAFYSILTPAAARELGLATQAMPMGFFITGVGGDNTASLATADTFGLAGATLNRIQFLVGGNALGGETAGLLGQNVLHIGDVEYDLANGVIRLWRPRDCAGGLLAYWVKPGQAYSVTEIRPRTDRDQKAVVEAKVNGAKVKVMLDTGAFASGMTLAAARRLGIDVKGPGAVSGGLTGGMGRRKVQSWIVPVASFKIGDEEITNTHLRVSDTGLTDIDMLVGADFFLSHRVFIANSQHKVYFTYNGGPVFDLTRARDQTAADTPPTPTGATGAGDADLNTPKDAEGFARRGAAFAARRDMDHAIADLAQAVTLAPTEEKYLAQRGHLYLDNNQPFLAMADFDRALTLTPDDIETRLLRARLRLSGHDRAQALADLDAADRMAAPQADARLTLAELLERAEAYPEAITQFGAWLKAHPDDSDRPQALAGRCWASALSGQDLTQALADCDSAIRARPGTANYLIDRGLVNLRLGDWQKAIADYDAALAIRPKVAWPYFGRGIAKLRLGKTDEGQADIAMAKSLAPNLADFAARRGVRP